MFCVDSEVWPALLQSPNQRFNGFVKTHSECDRDPLSAHEDTPLIKDENNQS